MDLTTEDVLIAKDELELGIMLGKGAFGTVHKGLYLGTEVAIKKMLVTDEETRKECIKEAKILKLEVYLLYLYWHHAFFYYRSLRHPCIITLMGVSLEETEFILVTNLIDGCNLHKAIFQKEILVKT